MTILKRIKIHFFAYCARLSMVEKELKFDFYTEILP